MAKPIVVVGAGIIGLCVAYSLQARGADVVILEAGEPGAGASSGNAGWITPSISGPLPMPGLARTSLRWMISASSPLYIRPRFDLEFLAWLLRFWRSCTREAYDRGVAATAELNRETTHLFAAMRAQGVSFELHEEGVIVVYRDERGRAADLPKFEELAQFGFKQPVVLDAAALHEAEPALSERARFGLLLSGEQYVRPETVVRGLVDYLTASGVRVRSGAAVCGIDRRAGIVTAVRTSSAEIAAEAIVVCAGAWTPALMRLVNVSVPIRAGKGYHLDFAPAPVQLRHGLNLADDRVVVTPLDGLVRLTGTLEVSHADDRRIARRRIEAIAAAAHDSLDGWPSSLAGAATWAGPRPITADGLPVIGRIPRFQNLYVASGHHMIGLTLGPATGEALAKLMLEGQPVPELAPFDPSRFA